MKIFIICLGIIATLSLLSSIVIVVASTFTSDNRDGIYKYANKERIKQLKKEKRKMIKKKELLKRIENIEGEVYGYKSLDEMGLRTEFILLKRKLDKLQQDHDQLVKAVEPIIAREVENSLDEFNKALDEFIAGFGDMFCKGKKPTASKKKAPKATEPEPAPKKTGRKTKGEK